MTFFTAGLQPPPLRAVDLMTAAPSPSQPVIVYTGPKRTGTELIAALAVDTEKQTPRQRGKKSRAGKKPAAVAEANDKKSGGRVSVTIDPNAPIKPAGAKHANAKPESGPKAAEKPAAAAAKPASKPGKPKAATKPKNSTTGEAQPADQKTAAAPRT